MEFGTKLAGLLGARGGQPKQARSPLASLEGSPARPSSHALQTDDGGGAGAWLEGACEAPAGRLPKRQRVAGGSEKVTVFTASLILPPMGDEDPVELSATSQTEDASKLALAEVLHRQAFGSHISAEVADNHHEYR